MDCGAERLSPTGSDERRRFGRRGTPRLGARPRGPERRHVNDECESLGDWGRGPRETWRVRQLRIGVPALLIRPQLPVALSRLQIYFGATHIQRHAHVCHRKTTLIRSEGRGPAASVNRTTDRLPPTTVTSPAPDERRRLTDGGPGADYAQSAPKRSLPASEIRVASVPNQRAHSRSRAHHAP